MKITKAIFPVAGLGTRFLPATKAQPKEMLTLVNKPIIQYGVEEAAAAGIGLMIFVTGRGKQAIENHFDASVELEDVLERKGKTELLDEIKKVEKLGKVVYVRQSQPLGLGHAVLQAKELVGDEYFAVFYPDDVIDAEVPCMKQMVDIFEKMQCGILAVRKTDAEGQKRYGIVAVEPTDNPKLHKVVDIVEKPGPENAPSDLASFGRLILPPSIFEELESTSPGAGGEIQLVDAIRALVKKQEFYAYEFEGELLDAGEIEGYVKATVKLALKRPELQEELKKFLRSVVE